MRLCEPITVPSGGLISTVCVILEELVKVIQLGKAARPVPLSHWTESKAPVVAQSYEVK